jgi:pilus assembly protein CpaB
MSILAVALFAGLACVGLLAHSMAAGKSRQPVVIAAAAPVAVVEKPMTEVLVAVHDLQVGDRLTAADMRWQPFPQEAINPAYIVNGPAPTTPRTDRAKVAAGVATAAGAAKTLVVGPTADGAAGKMVDAIVRESILTGEPILERKVVHAGAAGMMAVTLDPGKRAIAVPLSAESAAGGFILPGDHVDIVQSRAVDAAGGPKRVATSTVLENVRVLAIDQNTKPQKTANTAVGATATVEVSAAQAEALIAAKAQGDLTLTLRSYAETRGGSRLGPGASPGPVAVVRVFRNGVPTDVKVPR